MVYEIKVEVKWNYGAPGYVASLVVNGIVVDDHRTRKEDELERAIVQMQSKVDRYADMEVYLSAREEV